MDSKQLYTTWTVKGREYKMVLTSKNVVDLESKLQNSLINIISDGDVPSLTVMLTIAHKSLTKYEHGIAYDDMFDIYDQYIEEGGDQVSFMTDVFMPLFRVSGFFPKKTAASMGKQIENIKKEL